MNTKYTKDEKNDFEKKNMENVRKHRDIKLVTTDKRRNQLISEPSFYMSKWIG